MANISMDTLMIEIQSSTKNATSSIQSLINKLKTLNQSLESVMKQSESFSKLRTSIDNATKGINIPKQTKQTTQTTPNINMDNVKPTTNMSDLASQSTVLSKQGSLLSNYRSQLQAVGLTQSTLGKQISQTTNQTTKGTTEITKYQNSLGQLTVRARTASDGLTRYTTSLRNANKESKNNFLKSLTSGLSGATLQFRLAWDTIRGITTTLGNLSMNGASYYENLNLFATTLGDKAQEAFDWVNKFSDALYLDPSSVMQYMGTFNSLIKGLGVGTDDAYLMSQQLTQLTYDLSSFKNIPIEQAFEKLQSGISGEIEPLRNVGVALSEATLQELAYSLGIDKSVSSMSEAEKAQLRYIQVMKSSTEWQADMGKTLTSPANAIRVMKQQFTLLGRAIGNVFIPIIMFAIPYVMVFTEILTDLANALAKLLEKIFGIKLDFSLDTGGFDTSVGDITGGLTDIGDTADKTKNKLNTMLAPFDELNNIQTKSESTGSGSGTGGLGGGDLGVDLPTYNALDKLTDKFKNNIAEAKKNLEGLLPILGAIGLAIAGWKLANFISDISKSYKNMTSLGKLIARIAAGAALITIGLVFKFKGDEGARTNPEDLWKNMAMQLGSATSIGAGTYLITRNFTLSAIVTATSLTTSGVVTMSHGEEKNMWAGIAQTLGGIGLTAGSTFAKTHDVKLTLLVTIGVILMGLGTAMKELVDLEPTQDELEQALIHMWDDIPIVGGLGEKVGDALYDFTNNLSGVSDSITNFFKGVGNSLGDAIYSGVKRIQTIPKFVYEAIIQPIVQWILDIPERLSEMSDKIVNFFIDLGTMIGDGIYNGVQWLLGIPEWVNTNVIQPVKSFFSNLWTDIKNLASSTWESIKSIWGIVSSWFNDNIIQPIKNFFSGMWDLIKTLASGTWENIKKVWNAVSSWFNNTIIKPVGNFFSNMWNVIKNGASTAWNGIKSVFSSVTSFFSGIVNKIKTLFKNVGTSVANSISGAFKSVLNGAFSVIEKPINFFINGFNGAIGIINKIPGVNISKLDRISLPRFEDGGYPDSDLFLANENGIPEMVGRIGNQTAVANNDQITDAISSAVLQAINNSNFGNNSGGPTTIYIGNKKIYEGFGEHAQRENDRYGTNMIRI